MIDISAIAREGIERVYKEDYKSQLYYLQSICNDVRHIPVEAILAVNAIFIPNEDYIITYFGTEALDAKYNFYDKYGQCLWLNKLMLPITNVVNEIVGFVAFDPFRYLEMHETGNALLNYYSYSTKDVMKKGDYLFCTPGTYKKAYRDGYLVIADGVFDTLSVAYHGYNTAAMLGSVISDQLAAQLRLIDRVVVLMDNDEAGLALYEKIAKTHPNAIYLKQGKTKDADDIIKTRFRDEYFSALDKCINTEIALSRSIKIRKPGECIL